MTADTSRSNVLYLFQAEGAKELGGFIDTCLTIKNSNNSVYNVEGLDGSVTQDARASIN